MYLSNYLTVIYGIFIFYENKTYIIIKVFIKS